MSGQVQRVAVVGAGLMGCGIAESAAVAGIDVVLRDIDQGALEHAEQRLTGSLARAVERGKLSETDSEVAHARIRLTADFSEIATAQLVIEAVPEDERLKASVLSEVGALVGQEAIVASNTSSIPIAQLARSLSAPQRVLGLHFFSPVPVMGLVEVIASLDTSPETLSVARAFVLQLGKTPIESGDRAGFIVNLLLVPYLLAAVRMYEEGFASREDIDEGMRLGCGHPMGPLTLSDFIGLDVLDAVAGSLYEEFKREQYSSPPLLRRMIAAGRLGRKSGRGFYEYS